MDNKQNLSDTELVDLIKTSKDDPSSYIQALYERHGALINKVYSNYKPMLKASGVCMNDVYDNKLIVVYNSALSFNTDKNVKYTTHLFNCLRYQCLDLARQVTAMSKKNDLNFAYIYEKIHKDDNVEEIISKFKDEVDSLPDSDAKSILLMRYFSYNKEESKWKNIGAKMGTSPQNCINRAKKTFSKILNLIEQKHGIELRNAT